MTGTTSAVPDADDPRFKDPRRWATLVIVVATVVIVVLDNTILTVAIPTILREFDTTLPSLQWVVTGYALTFATLLIIGGRLGDMFGHRRVFIVGLVLFASGSAIASLSTDVPSLFVGEALIEGIGASLMTPATLAILSNTFTGRERAGAFAVWGAVAGAAAAFGPVVGGYLTTYHSWRWAFRINVIIAPVAIIGALLFTRPDRDLSRRGRLDIAGAALVAVGMFSLVFGLSQGATYGWITPTTDFDLGPIDWPATRPISIIPFVFAVAFIALGSFALFERRMERRGGDPLFELGLLRYKRFRYGIITAIIVAMGQFGLIFVMPVLLQDGRRLSAMTCGMWMVLPGIFVIVGAQVGGRLTRRVGTTRVVQGALLIEAMGLAVTAFVVAPDVTLLGLLPGFVLYGCGIGAASAQLTNVILADTPPDKAGVASGVNSTARQSGFALGIAVIGSILSAVTINVALDRLGAGRGLDPALHASLAEQVRTQGVNFTPPPGTSPADLARLHATMSDAIAAGARPALLFAAVVVTAGMFVSLLIPRIGPPDEPDAHGSIDAFEAFEPIDPEGYLERRS